MIHTVVPFHLGNIFFKRFAAAVALSVYVALDAGAWPQASDPVRMPPSDLWWTGVASAGDGPRLHSLATIRTDARQLRLTWRRYPAFPAVTDGIVEDQTYDLSYWPTYATSAGGWSYYVAGQRANGNTVIERWSFSRPIETEAVDPATGRTTFSLAPGRREQVSTVYDEATPGRALVAQMVKMAGDLETRLLVRFHDSKEAWILDPATGAIELAASPSSQVPAGVLSIPELAQPFRSLEAKRHLVHGYVYVFTWGGAEGAVGTSQDPLVILDADRDGDLDTYVIADEATWGAMGFADASNYE